MAEDEDIDSLKDALEDDKDLKDERIERTQEDELGDYEDLPDDYDWSEDYGLEDAQKDIAELKQEVREKQNLSTKPQSERDDVEEKVSQMLQLLELHEVSGLSRTDPKEEGHKFHEAYTMMIAMGMIAAGFLYSGMFMSLYILGVLYVLYDNAKFLPGEKDSWFARLTSNHPRFYILGGIVTGLLFLGAGYEFPMPEGLIATLAQAAVTV